MRSYRCLRSLSYNTPSLDEKVSTQYTLLCQLFTNQNQKHTTEVTNGNQISTCPIISNDFPLAVAVTIDLEGGLSGLLDSPAASAHRSFLTNVTIDSVSTSILVGTPSTLPCTTTDGFCTFVAIVVSSSFRAPLHAGFLFVQSLLICPSQPHCQQTTFRFWVP